MTRMHIGVQMQPQHSSWPEYLEAVRTVEAMGVDSIWTWDHFFPLTGDPGGKHFEGWSALSAIAAITTRPRVGCFVTCNSYRNTALLAQMAKTVDHISNGRLCFAIGSGWFERDYEEFGYEFGTVGSRLRQLEADLPVLKARLQAEVPPPIQNPLPIMIGGGGEKLTLRIVAGHADLWNTFGPPDSWIHKNRVLDDWCAKVGRDPAEIVRTVGVGVQDLDGNLDKYAAAGATQFIFSRTVPWDYAPLEQLIRWRDR